MCQSCEDKQTGEKGAHSLGLARPSDGWVLWWAGLHASFGRQASLSPQRMPSCCSPQLQPPPNRDLLFPSVVGVAVAMEAATGLGEWGAKWVEQFRF